MPGAPPPLMNLSPFLAAYETLVEESEAAFVAYASALGGALRCRKGCADCCHAVFGLFLVEAVAIQRHFQTLERKKRREALLRGKKGERAYARLEERLRGLTDPRTASEVLARERIRCALLGDEDACLLYPHRPLTCRVYGMPTLIRGKTRVCPRAAQPADPSLAPFPLDRVHDRLHRLSRDMLLAAGRMDPERAALLLSLPAVLRTSEEALLCQGPE